MLQEGSTVGHFRIVGQIGAGGMGVVYLAEDLRLGRRVALKVLTAAHDAVAVRRFLGEARTASSLDHPNIAAVFEVGEEHSPPFIAMAYCPGETLRDRILRGPLPLTATAGILEQVASALACAHASGVVHRDLKPANIMVGPDGSVRVVDFGLATVRADDQTATRLTRAGSAVGTVAYMSPEQLTGQSVDGRADVWALGVTLYEMLTGGLPFDGGEVFAVMEAVVRGTAVPVRSRRPETPAEFVHILERALTKDPGSTHRRRQRDCCSGGWRASPPDRRPTRERLPHRSGGVDASCRRHSRQR